MKNSEIIKFLLETQTQFRILHWQTKSYAKHNAYGSIYESLDGFIDDFIEIYMDVVQVALESLVTNYDN